jgi:predicted RNase H-like nuclease (RuvC/YqgF family)
MDTGTSAPTGAPTSGAPQSLEGQANEVESRELGQSPSSEETVGDDQQAPQKHKVKVNGKEVEVTLEDLKKRYEHAQAANEKFRQAAEVQKQYQQAQQEIQKVKGVFDHLKGNPTSFFELADALGVDLDKLAHEHVLKQYKIASMSDDERRVYDMEQKLSKYEQDRQRYQQEEQQRNKSATLQRARTDVESSLVNFFTDQKITPTPEMMERVLSDALYFAEESGMSLPQAIARAHNRYASSMSRLKTQALEEAIRTGQVPDDLRTLFRKADVEKLGNPFRSKQESRPPNDTPRQQNRSNKPVTQTDDFFNRLENKYRGRK